MTSQMTSGLNYVPGLQGHSLRATERFSVAFSLKKMIQAIRRGTWQLHGQGQAGYTPDGFR